MENEGLYIKVVKDNEEFEVHVDPDRAIDMAFYILKEAGPIDIVKHFIKKKRYFIMK